MMKHAIIDQFDTPRKGKNLGDYVQTLATMQFCNDPIFVDREHLDSYCGEKVKMIMNSWFISYPKNWPPSDDIEPLFVSSHFTDISLKQILNEKGKKYFKKYEPIGCRDTATCNTLQKNGINAYFSACLTLTLGKTYKRENIGNEILFIDVLYNYRTIKEIFFDIFQDTRTFGSRIKRGGITEVMKIINDLNNRKKYLKKFFSDELLSRVTFVSQLAKLKRTDNHLQVTDEYLKRLSKAKLVVTSRIHCALPCLAIGTPVIFIDSELDQNRVSGLKDLFHTITIEKKDKITVNFDCPPKIGMDFNFVNKTDFVKYKNDLISKCEKFINQ